MGRTFNGKTPGLSRDVLRMDIPKIAEAYSVLNLERNCAPEKLRSAYLDAVKKHHPDKGGCGQRLRQINEAYSVLTKQKGVHVTDEHLRRSRAVQYAYARHRQYEPAPNFLNLTPATKEMLRKTG